MNKNEKKMKTMKNNINKKSIVSPMLFFLSAYLVISLLVIIIFAPYVFNSLRYMIIDLNPELALLIFMTALTVSILIIVLLIHIFLKRKFVFTNNELDNMKSDIELYGKYDEERKYLEDRMDELNQRLTGTEEMWKKINHLVLMANQENSDNSGDFSCEQFLSEFGIKKEDYNVEKSLVFVLTPADKKFYSDYSVVKKVCDKLGLCSKRGDEQDLNYLNDNMLGHILMHILKSRIVIANISNRNPNVYYELGIAHALGKPTILLCRNGNQVPFDLKQKYIIFYSNEEELSKKLQIAILKILTN